MFHNSTGVSALAAYFDVMEEGQKAAIEWLELVRESRQVLLPQSMAGRNLYFPGCNDISTTLSILSCPVAPSLDHHFRISQGELWKGTIDLKSLYNETTTKNLDQVYWCSKDGLDPPGVKFPILVKVTSQSCYGLLTGGQGFLYQINTYEKEWPNGKVDRVLRLLKDSLYAVYVPLDGSGIVQIMPDLRLAGYQQLRPSAQLLTKVWEAFSVMVKKVLTPLAEDDVIHVDIRPGFEWTANLLFHPNKFKMLLIDADSLVLFRVWKVLSKQVKGLKLITALPGSDDPQTALEFVLWQVIYVGETWMSRTQSHEASILPIFGSQKSDRVTSLLAGRSFCNHATIAAGLERYRQEIARAADADLVPAAVSVAETPPAVAASGRLPEWADAAAFAPPAGAAAAAAAAAVSAEVTQQIGTATRIKRRLPDT
jgi:hypothetical protein